MSSARAGWIDYDWAAIRVVPRVHVEQFVCVGVMVHARQADEIEARLALDWRDRLADLDAGIDLARVERHLDTFTRIARGDEGAGPIALLPPSERFHWLTHPRSGIIQTSARHPGRSRDLSRTLEELLKEQCA